MLAVEDLESLEETLSILQDSATMQALAMAEVEVTANDTVGHDALRDLVARRPVGE